MHGPGFGGADLSGQNDRTRPLNEKPRRSRPRGMRCGDQTVRARPGRPSADRRSRESSQRTTTPARSPAHGPVPTVHQPSRGSQADTEHGLRLPSMGLAVTLPDDVAARLAAEAAKRDITPDQPAAELIAARLPASQAWKPGARLRLAAIGPSTVGQTAAQGERVLAERFGSRAALDRPQASRPHRRVRRRA